MRYCDGWNSRVAGRGIAPYRVAGVGFASSEEICSREPCADQYPQSGDQRAARAGFTNRTIRDKL
jgi:hypothetical protein